MKQQNNFQKKGLFVYLGSRDLVKGKATVKELNEKGFQNIKAIEIDVINPQSVLTAKNIVENEQGKLDILINNAGILGINPQSTTETSVDDIKEVFETNFFGVINVTQTFFRATEEI
ncbi:SDR family NAD(P)-dependent oxidoreductase [Chryseobacterium aquaticum]|uniref:SDR family NAD(P)-dependent oxidoreductase n=1 Tax=Chryseobacterium aquaticum TaxID=452084 RepID=UPI002FCAB388